MGSVDLADYYGRRAPQYEAIYEKPERQADLAALRAIVRDRLRGRRVVEVACGTGYWTQVAAEVAAQLVATDIAEDTLRLAREKRYARTPSFRLADAYALPAALGAFDAAFAVFWWSHVPRGRIASFLASLHACLEPGATVLLIDNRYVEGSSTPIAVTDAEGNTYQRRRLADGTEGLVLKNFPSETELRAALPAPLAYQALEYYWIAEYRRP